MESFETIMTGTLGVTWKYQLISTVAFMVLVLVLYQFRKYSLVKKLVKAMISEAEMEIIGRKKGQERMSYVVNKFKSYFPFWIRIFLNDEFITKIVQEAFNWTKEKFEVHDESLKIEGKEEVLSDVTKVVVPDSTIGAEVGRGVGLDVSTGESQDLNKALKDLINQKQKEIEEKRHIIYAKATYDQENGPKAEVGYQYKF